VKSSLPLMSRSGFPPVASSYQGLTLVPNFAQLELISTSYNPTQLMNVSWSCSS
jgi:hypothetical protein